MRSTLRLGGLRGVASSVCSTVWVGSFMECHVVMLYSSILDHQSSDNSNPYQVSLVVLTDASTRIC